MQLNEADWLNIERELCSRSLAEFAKRAWRVLEPAAHLKWGWVLDAICGHLEAVSNGDIKRLLINVPPGSMKSLLTSVIFPAWEWGPRGKPELRYLSTAHKQDLAVRDNLKCRRLITSQWYQELWPVPLTGDQNAKTKFENTSTGFREAMAFTSLTGSRGDCLTFDAIIQTRNGPMKIGDIVESGGKFDVLSAKTDTGELVYRPVEAVARRYATEIYRVHTSCGRIVECTGDHRIYTDGGFKEARLLSAGDGLMWAVRSPDNQEDVRNKKGLGERSEGVLLRPELCSNSFQYSAREVGAVLRGVQCENTERPKAVRLKRLSCGIAQAVGAVGSFANTRTGLLALRQDVQAEIERDAEFVLLGSLQGQGALKNNAGRPKSNVARGGGCAPVRPAKPSGVQEGKGRHTGSGCPRLRGLRHQEKSMRSPYGYGHVKQHLAKPSDSVQGMPRHMAQYEALASGQTTVAMVERIPRSEVVYDIQVAETRCFFANGILVHNCVILDDPHSVDDANSKAHLEAAVKTFREALPSRVNNESSAIVIIMQRLHEKDVSAEALELGYDHLCIPMRYEVGRSKTTSIGWSDPRKEDGELMFPERFTLEQVVELEKSLGSYASAGQLQQRPSPAGGGIFKAEAIKHWSVLPDIEHLIIYGDTAMKVEEKNDFSVFELWAKGKNGSIYMVDMIRDKWEAPQLLVAAQAFWDKHRATYGGKLRKLMVEDKASGTGLIQQLRQAGIPVEGIQRNRDKVSRAHDTVPQIEVGRVYLPERHEHLSVLLDELKTFPAAAHDDCVDPLMDAVQDMLNSKDGYSWSGFL